MNNRTTFKNIHKTISIIICGIFLFQQIAWGNPEIFQKNTLQPLTLITGSEINENIYEVASIYIELALTGRESVPFDRNVPRIRKKIYQFIGDMNNNEKIPAVVKQKFEVLEKLGKITLKLGNIRIKYFNPNLFDPETEKAAEEAKGFSVKTVRIGEYLYKQKVWEPLEINEEKRIVDSIQNNGARKDDISIASVDNGGESIEVEQNIVRVFNSIKGFILERSLVQFSLRGLLDQMKLSGISMPYHYQDFIKRKYKKIIRIYEDADLHSEAQHAIRVAMLSVLLYKKAQSFRIKSFQEMDDLVTAALAHDLGKIDKEIVPLIKNGKKLSSNERETIETHADKSIEVLKAKEIHINNRIKTAIIEHSESNIRDLPLSLVSQILYSADQIDARHDKSRSYKKRKLFNWKKRKLNDWDEYRIVHELEKKEEKGWINKDIVDVLENLVRHKDPLYNKVITSTYFFWDRWILWFRNRFIFKPIGFDAVKKNNGDNDNNNLEKKTLKAPDSESFGNGENDDVKYVDDLVEGLVASGAEAIDSAKIGEAATYIKKHAPPVYDENEIDIEGICRKTKIYILDGELKDHLGIPRFPEAKKPSDFLYVYMPEKYRFNNIKAYVTRAYYEKHLKNNTAALAELIDHEFVERTLGFSHRFASSRARFFIENGKLLSPFHLFYINQLIKAKDYEAISKFAYDRGVSKEISEYYSRNKEKIQDVEQYEFNFYNYLRLKEFLSKAEKENSNDVLEELSLRVNELSAEVLNKNQGILEINELLTVSERKVYSKLLEHRYFPRIYERSNKVNLDISQIEFSELLDYDDNTVFVCKKMQKAGKFKFKGQDPVLMISEFGSKKIAFNIRNGDIFQVWCFDDNDRISGFKQMGQIFEKNGSFRKRFHRGMPEKEFDNLGDCTIKEYRLNPNGGLILGGKVRKVNFGRFYANCKVEITVTKGQIDDVRIFNEYGKEVKEAKHSLIYSRGKLVGSFYRILSKQKLQKFNKATIKHYFLDKVGRLNLTATGDTTSSFEQFPYHEVEFDLLDGHIDKVRILDENGEVLKEVLYKLLYDKPGKDGKVIFSYKDVVDEDKFSKLTGILKRLKTDSKGSIWAGKVQLAQNTKYKHTDAEAEIENGMPKIIKFFKNLAKRELAGKPLRYKLIYDTGTGKLIDYFHLSYTKEKRLKLKDVTVKRFYLAGSDGVLRFGDEKWVSLKEYAKHRIEFDVVNGVVTEVRVFNKKGDKIKTLPFVFILKNNGGNIGELVDSFYDYCYPERLEKLTDHFITGISLDKNGDPPELLRDGGGKKTKYIGKFKGKPYQTVILHVKNGDVHGVMSLDGKSLKQVVILRKNTNVISSDQPDGKNVTLKAPNTETLGNGSDDNIKYVNDLVDSLTANGFDEIPMDEITAASKYIKEHAQPLEDTEFDDDVVRKTRIIILDGLDHKLGVPRFEGAQKPSDHIYVFQPQNSIRGRIRAYVTREYYEKYLKNNVIALAEAIDHEYTERVLGLSHRIAASRSRYFVPGNDFLSPFHKFYIEKLIEEEDFSLTDQEHGIRENRLPTVEMKEAYQNKREDLFSIEKYEELFFNYARISEFIKKTENILNSENKNHDIISEYAIRINAILDKCPEMQLSEKQKEICDKILPERFCLSEFENSVRINKPFNINSLEDYEGFDEKTVFTGTFISRNAGKVLDKYGQTHMNLRGPKNSFIGKEIAFTIKDGDFYKIWVLDNGKIIHLYKMYQIHDEKGNFYKRYLNRIGNLKELGLDNFTIYGYRLLSRGTLKMGGRTFQFGEYFSNCLVEINVKDKFIDKVIIFNEFGEKIKECKFCSILNKDTGKIVDTFYDTLMKSKMSELDNVTIKNKRLDSDGLLRIGGRTRFLPKFTEYPKHKVEIDICKGHIDKVKILGEDGSVLKEVYFKIIYDADGEIYDSFHFHIPKKELKKINGTIKRLKTDNATGDIEVGHVHLANKTGYKNFPAEAEVENGWPKIIRIFKKDTYNWDAGTGELECDPLRYKLIRNEKVELVYSYLGHLPPDSQEIQKKLKKAVVSEFYLRDDCHLRFYGRDWMSFNKKYKGHKIKFDVENGVVTRVYLFSKNGKKIIKTYKMTLFYEIDEKGKKTLSDSFYKLYDVKRLEDKEYGIIDRLKLNKEGRLPKFVLKDNNRRYVPADKNFVGEPNADVLLYISKGKILKVTYKNGKNVSEIVRNKPRNQIDDAVTLKAPGTSAFGNDPRDDKKQMDLFIRGLTADGADEVQEDEKMEAMEYIRKNAPRVKGMKFDTKKISLDTEIIIVDGLDEMMGFPRFFGAERPADLLYVYQPDLSIDGQVKAYITRAYYEKQIKGNPIALAELLDHEYSEQVLHLSHRMAASRTAFFASEGGLSPFHNFFLNELDQDEKFELAMVLKKNRELPEGIESIYAIREDDIAKIINYENNFLEEIKTRLFSAAKDGSIFQADRMYKSYLSFESRDVPKKDHAHIFNEDYVFDTDTGEPTIVNMAWATEKDMDELRKIDNEGFIRFSPGSKIIKLFKTDSAGEEIIVSAVKFRKIFSTELEHYVIFVEGIATNPKIRSKKGIGEFQLAAWRLIQQVVKESRKDHFCAGRVVVYSVGTYDKLYESLKELGFIPIEKFDIKDNPLIKNYYLLNAEESEVFVEKIERYIKRKACLLRMEKVGERGLDLVKKIEDEDSHRSMEEAYRTLMGNAVRMKRRIGEKYFLDDIQKEKTVALIKMKCTEMLEELNEKKNRDVTIDVKMLRKISEIMSSGKAMVDFNKIFWPDLLRSAEKKYSDDADIRKHIQKYRSVPVGYADAILHSLRTYYLTLEWMYVKNGQNRISIDQVVKTLEEILSRGTIDEIFDISSEVLDKTIALFYMRCIGEHENGDDAEDAGDSAEWTSAQKNDGNLKAPAADSIDQHEEQYIETFIGDDSLLKQSIKVDMGAVVDRIKERTSQVKPYVKDPEFEFMDMSEKIKFKILIGADVDNKLGIPKFKGAKDPEDLIYVYPKNENGHLNLYMTYEFYTTFLDKNIPAMAEIIDHEYVEKVLGYSHRFASSRARFFAADENSLSPFHEFYLNLLDDEKIVSIMGKIEENRGYETIQRIYEDNGDDDIKSKIEAIKKYEDRFYKKLLERLPLEKSSDRSIPFYRNKVEIKLPREYIQEKMEHLSDKVEEIHDVLGDKINRDNVLLINIPNYVKSLKYLDQVFVDTDLNSKKFKEYLSDFYYTMLQEEITINMLYDLKTGKESQVAIKEMMNKIERKKLIIGTEIEAIIDEIFAPENQERIMADPEKAAAETFVKIIRAQAMPNGNHRIADFVSNFILVKNGYPYFVLTPDNIIRYYTLLNTVDLRDAYNVQDIDIDEIKAFFEEELQKNPYINMPGAINPENDEEKEVVCEILEPEIFDGKVYEKGAMRVTDGKMVKVVIEKADIKDAEKLQELDGGEYIKYEPGSAILKLSTVKDSIKTIRAATKFCKIKVPEQKPFIFISGIAIEQDSREMYSGTMVWRLLREVVKESLNDTDCLGRTVVYIAKGTSNEKIERIERSLSLFGFSLYRGEIPESDRKKADRSYVLDTEKAESFIDRVEEYLGALSQFVRMKKIGEAGFGLELPDRFRNVEDDMRVAFNALSNFDGEMERLVYEHKQLLNETQRSLVRDIIKSSVRRVLGHLQNEVLLSDTGNLKYQVLYDIQRYMSRQNAVKNFYDSSEADRYKNMAEDQERFAQSYTSTILHSFNTYFTCLCAMQVKKEKEFFNPVEMITVLREVEEKETKIEDMFRICSDVLDKTIKLLHSKRVWTEDEIVDNSIEVSNKFVETLHEAACDEKVYFFIDSELGEAENREVAGELKGLIRDMTKLGKGSLFQNGKHKYLLNNLEVLTINKENASKILNYKNVIVLTKETNRKIFMNARNNITVTAIDTEKDCEERKITENVYIPILEAGLFSVGKFIYNPENKFDRQFLKDCYDLIPNAAPKDIDEVINLETIQLMLPEAEPIKTTEEYVRVVNMVREVLSKA